MGRPGVGVRHFHRSDYGSGVHVSGPPIAAPYNSARGRTFEESSRMLRDACNLMFARFEAQHNFPEGYGQLLIQAGMGGKAS